MVELENFKSDLVKKDISFMISKWIIEKIPFIFENDLENYINWKELLGNKIGIDSKAIILTGSSSVGFSLNPEKNLRSFTSSSDIDVAVVSQHYFDISWHFLRNIGTKRYSYNRLERDAIDDHRTRLIYWGTIATDKIIQILPFGENWVTSLNQMAKFDPTKDRDINLRIYKDFDALRAYHYNNLKIIKDLIIAK